MSARDFGLSAIRAQELVEFLVLTILRTQFHLRIARLGAEVGAVLQQSPFAAKEPDGELGGGDVGDVREDGTYPADFRAFLPYRVEETDEGGVNRSVQVDHEVREFAFASVGAEVDGP